jgi:pimeloyl-ACP methyl ester carboxylesterase
VSTLLTALLIAVPASSAQAAARLVNKRPCPREPGFTCATLTVPLDHAHQVPGLLRLSVGVQSTPRATRGVLVFLAGGPGQPGLPFLSRIHELLGAAFADYRLVMLNQRGTGSRALQCPALQKAVGSSDLAVAPPGSVAACARSIGPKRRFFTTAETIADIDSLRIALGARRLTLDGISYGTFVEERYALVYPKRVARMVLDSVVPQQGIDLLPLTTFKATVRVLRLVCAAERCGYDPARDLHGVVRKRHDGPRLLDAISSMSIGKATFKGLLPALHAARAGHYAALDAIVRREQSASAATAEELSQGLHESTLCMDLPRPYDPTAPRAQRAATLRRLAAHVRPAAFFPFDRATALGTGDIENCLEWPPTVPPAVPAGNPNAKLAVPVLIVQGNRDLSTPLAWAQSEAHDAPGGRLVVVPGVGHSVQTTKGPAIRPLLRRFLHTH